MWDLLHSFAVGIAFSLGVCSGAALAQFANRKAREEFVEDVKREHAAVNERLAQQVEALTRMAIAAEMVSDRLSGGSSDNRGPNNG